MRKRGLRYFRLLIALYAPLSLLPLQAATPDEWHSAADGSGVEYRWTIGFWKTCHIEFRDLKIKGTSRNTQISGVIDYDRTMLDAVERNALQSFTLTIFGVGTTSGPDAACEQINEVKIQELKRSSPPL